MYNRNEQIITKNFIPIRKKYFDEIVMPVFNQISNVINPIVKTYCIANKIIKMNFYSHLMYEKLFNSISHNEIKMADSFDLIINIWDSVSTSTHLLSPWLNDEYIQKPEINSHKNISESFLGVYIAGEQTLNFYDKTKKEAYFWSNDSNNLSDWLTAAPVRTILNWFLIEDNIHLIHGAVIGFNDSSILLTAKGGSGKSTTALSCLLSGMDYLSDDYFAVEIKDRTYCYGLYNSGKLVPEFLDHFPKLKEMIWNKNNLDKEKAIFLLSEIFPNQIIRQSNLKAILIPVIKNINKTNIIPADKIHALKAIIPTTLFQLPLTESNKIQFIRELVDKLPCYFIELSSDIAEIPNAIKKFIHQNFTGLEI